MNHYMKKQDGAVLIVGLVMLLLITIIGLAGMKDSILQESMASNLRDRNIAFQVAEAGLRAGEDELRKATISVPIINPVTKPGDPCFWWGCGGSTATFNWGSGTSAVTPDLDYGVPDPQFILELLPALPKVASGNSAKFSEVVESRVYRITARAGGGTGDSVVVLQSTYKR